MSNDKKSAVDFPALDVLRLVGALAVLTTHVAFQTGEYFRNGVLGTLLARLDIGVAVFFVLSGFLLSRAWWVSSETGTAAPDLGRYAIKRLLRIWPVYVLTASVALAVVPGNEGAGVGDWVTSALLLDTYVDDTLPYGLTQMWSLSVEVAFYVALPFLMWVARRRSRLPADLLLLVGMVVLSVAWIVTVAPAIDDVRDWAPALWLPGYLSWFAAGMWLARTHVRHGVRGGRVPWIVSLGQQPGACWTAAIGLLLAAATPVAGPVTLEPGTSAESVTKTLVYAVIGLLVVAAGVWSPSAGLFRRMASARPLRHLGHVSYSMFCTHLIVLALIQERIDYAAVLGSVHADVGDDPGTDLGCERAALLVGRAPWHVPGPSLDALGHHQARHSGHGQDHDVVRPGRAACPRRRGPRADNVGEHRWSEQPSDAPPLHAGRSRRARTATTPPSTPATTPPHPAVRRTRTAHVASVAPVQRVDSGTAGASRVRRRPNTTASSTSRHSVPSPENNPAR